MSTGNSLHIRAAVREDAPLVLAFVRELADYEKMLDQVTATRSLIEDSLFGDSPAAEVLFAEWDGEPAGFALFFSNYSTFVGRPGVYLEDLFVRPAFRGHGIGKTLLARVAAVAIDRGGARLDWAVLDWNESALNFYRHFGARTLGDWVINRLEGKALSRLVAQS